MTKKIIEVELEDLTYSLEGTLGDLEKKAHSLVVKYGRDARLRIEVERDYDSEYVRVSVYGKREETDSEYHARLAFETRMQETREAIDRREYERLKAKFKEET